MKHLQQWKNRVGFLLASVLFTSFIAAPNVFAAGYTWTDVTASGAEHGLGWMSIASSSSGQYLAAVADGTGAGGDIYTSADYGATWTDVTLSGVAHGLNWASIASSSSGQYLAAASDGTGFNGGDIYTSADYGQTWTDVTASGAGHNLGWQSIASSSSGQHLAAGVNGGDIYIANDPALAPPSPQGGSTSSSTSAPDTGYGVPAQFDPVITVIVASATISAGVGLALLYRQKS